jgi:tetratricopeptide (TPR) repeat protein
LVPEDRTVPPRFENSIEELASDRIAGNAKARDVVRSPTLAVQPEYQTAGTVHAMLEIAHEKLDNTPAETLAIARSARAIAERFPVDSGSIHLRGWACREEANALRYLGRLQEGLDAIGQAASLFGSLLVSTFDLATVDYIRASILQEQGKCDEAIELARRAAVVFAEFGETRRHAHARLLEAAVFYRMGRVSEAREVFASLEVGAWESRDLKTLAGILHNLGDCDTQLGNYDVAEAELRAAIVTYRDFQMVTEIARARWLLGRVAWLQSDLASAIEILEETEREFTRKQMKVDAGLVALDIIEILLSQGETRAALSRCASLAERFTAEGMPIAAATAIEQLRRSVEMGEADRATVATARTSLEESRALVC